MKISRILCAVDLSQASRRLLVVANELSEKMSARLTVVHADDETWTSVLPPPYSPVLRDERDREIAERVQELGAAAPTADFQVLKGTPERVILETSRRVHADVIVVGTHGRGGFRRHSLGTVAEKVLHHAESDLLVVPVETSIEPEPIDGWARVLLAVDLGDTTAVNVRTAVDLTRTLRAKLWILNVTDAIEDVFPGLGGFWASPELSSLADQIDERRNGAMRALLSTSEQEELHAQLLLRRGAPYAVINRTVSEIGAHLLVIGAHGHGKTAISWLGSTVHKVLRTATCPTWVIKR